MSEDDRHNESVAETIARKSVGPVGLGGWLILPIIGLFITPLVGLYNLSQSMPALQNLSFLSEVQGSFIIAEAVGILLVQCVAPIVLLALLFGRRRAFPKLYQLLLAIGLALVIFDLAGAYAIFESYYTSGQAVFWDQDAVRSIVQAIVSAVIWIPYMRVSQRVKNTFVN